MHVGFERSRIVERAGAYEASITRGAMVVAPDVRAALAAKEHVVILPGAALEPELIRLGPVVRRCSSSIQRLITNALPVIR